MRDVLVWENVDNVLWQVLPDEESFKNLRDRLFENLEQRFDRVRKERHPEDETLFICKLYMFEGDKKHTFEFHVDDTTADTCVIVLDVVHTVE
jgi:hypothetical protein